MRENSSLPGHSAHRWNDIYESAFDGGAVDYKQTDNLAFNNLTFSDRTGCDFGTHCMQFENTSPSALYSNVTIGNETSTTTLYDIEMTGGAGVTISNGTWGIGNTGLSSLPASDNLVYLNNVNQLNTYGNSCTSLSNAIGTINCLYLDGTSTSGNIRENLFSNAGGVTAFNGAVFGASTSGNWEHSDTFVSGVTNPSFDLSNGNNLTSFAPTVLAPGSSPIVMANGNGTQAIIGGASGTPHFVPVIYPGGDNSNPGLATNANTVPLGAVYGSMSSTKVQITTNVDTPSGSNTFNLANLTGLIMACW